LIKGAWFKTRKGNPCVPRGKFCGGEEWFWLKEANFGERHSVGDEGTHFENGARRGSKERGLKAERDGLQGAVVSLNDC
jgi:hypothetical protein